MSTGFISDAQIEARLRENLGVADSGCLSVAVETVHEPTDRLYGQLVAGTYTALAGTSDLDSVLSAAAAVELLRGYLSVRSRMLAPHDKTFRFGEVEFDRALLASDYLYTTAFSVLTSSTDSGAEPQIEVLADSVETMVQGLARTYTPAGGGPVDPGAFIDDTVGSIGSGAVLLGATLANGPDFDRSLFDRFGRSVTASRYIDEILHSGSGEVVLPPVVNVVDLYLHAEERRHDAMAALDGLAKGNDVSALRSFLEDSREADRTDGGGNNGRCGQYRRP